MFVGAAYGFACSCTVIGNNRHLVNRIFAVPALQGLDAYVGDLAAETSLDWCGVTVAVEHGPPLSVDVETERGYDRGLGAAGEFDVAEEETFAQYGTVD